MQGVCVQCLCTMYTCAYCMGLAIQPNAFSVEIQCTLWFIHRLYRLHVDWIKFNENCPLIIHFHWNALVFFVFVVAFISFSIEQLQMHTCICYYCRLIHSLRWFVSFASIACMHCIALSVSQSISRVVIGHLIFYNMVSWYFIWLLLSLDRSSEKILISIIIINAIRSLLL